MKIQEEFLPFKALGMTETDRTLPKKQNAVLVTLCCLRVKYKKTLAR